MAPVLAQVSLQTTTSVCLEGSMFADLQEKGGWFCWKLLNGTLKCQ